MIPWIILQTDVLQTPEILSDPFVYIGNFIFVIGAWVVHDIIRTWGNPYAKKYSRQSHWQTYQTVQAYGYIITTWGVIVHNSSCFVSMFLGIDGQLLWVTLRDWSRFTLHSMTSTFNDFSQLYKSRINICKSNSFIPLIPSFRFVSQPKLNSSSWPHSKLLPLPSPCSFMGCSFHWMWFGHHGIQTTIAASHATRTQRGTTEFKQKLQAKSLHRKSICIPLPQITIRKYLT